MIFSVRIFCSDNIISEVKIKNHIPLKNLLVLIIAGIVLLGCSKKRDTERILVFSKTAGFRHESIKDGILALQKLGQEKGFEVDTTENSLYFVEDSLRNYSAIVFLNTTGDVLTHRQQKEFERYIQAGGGFVGIHSATDTEYSWPWFGELAGAYFNGHPAIAEATLNVVDKNHPSTEMLPEKWERTDEWYNFKSISPSIKPLIKLDESTYEGGTNGDNHPIAWYHEFDGGRAFYSGLGHTSEAYSDPLVLEHFYGGIKYAIGENKLLDYSKAHTVKMPEESRFIKIVLDENLDEPMELAVDDNGRVFFVERNGALKLYDPEVKETKVVKNFAVYSGHENGLLGITLDPLFNKNGWVYIFYSPTSAGSIQRISRFQMVEDSILDQSEKVLLEIPLQTEECCHSGGSLAFGPDGNLFISLGDNTNPFASDGYAPIDEREGRQAWDAQRTSANTDDLNGKILRIHPENDGTYTIPAGNLFPKDGSKGRPEIYVMGNRNPFRISIDQRTKFLYWGEVGPDAGKDSIFGPRGHDEINQARKAGFFGWPYFIGDNKPYRERNFSDSTTGDLFNAEAPINNSVNNTGIKSLPPAQKALIYYPYAESPEFPIVGKGGRNAMAGPVYYFDDYEDSPVKFPEYYDGKLFIYDWMRNWVMAVTLSEEGDLVDIEKFLPGLLFDKPMDMQFGKDGALYMLEYGTYWFAQNEDARLVKIEYAASNRKPIANVKADITVGASPLEVTFSATESFDYDKNDKLEYKWYFTSKDEVQSEQAKPTFTFEKPGIYNVVLEVSDSEGETASTEVEIKVGNAVPEISLSFEGNSTFFWENDEKKYTISVSDKEDGSTTDGSIPAGDVKAYFDYLELGSDKTLIAQGHQINTTHPGLLLIEASDCKSCHALDKKSVGPSYEAVAERYKGEDGAVEKLVSKIIQGGSGVWGENAMSAHPQISNEDATEMVNYILSLGDEAANTSIPLQGSVATNKGSEGIYIFSLAYTDKGANGIDPITVKKEHILQAPRLRAVDYDGAENMRKMREESGNYLVKAPESNSFFYFNDVDLTEVKKLIIKNKGVGASGQLEIRLDKEDGRLLGAIKINDGGFKEVPVSLPDVNGKHDLYFVFESKGDLSSRRTLDVEWIYFQR